MTDSVRPGTAFVSSFKTGTISFSGNANFSLRDTSAVRKLMPITRSAIVIWYGQGQISEYCNTIRTVIKRLA